MHPGRFLSGFYIMIAKLQYFRVAMQSCLTHSRTSHPSRCTRKMERYCRFVANGHGRLASAAFLCLQPRATHSALGCTTTSSTQPLLLPTVVHEFKKCQKRPTGGGCQVGNMRAAIVSYIVKNLASRTHNSTIQRGKEGDVTPYSLSYGTTARYKAAVLAGRALLLRFNSNPLALAIQQ